MTDDLIALLPGFALRAAVVLACAWPITAAMRRASAAARHLVWTCAIAAAALVPATSLVSPDWTVTSPIPVETSRLMPRGDVTKPAPGSPLAPERDTNQATVAPAAPFSRSEIALALWATGTSLVLLYLLFGVVCAARLRARATLVDPAAPDDVQDLAEALGITTHIAVVNSPAAPTPMVCGIWRPAIVLPAAAASWSEERRHLVLMHELAHIKRRDCVTQLLAHVVCAVYWFNPLAWLAARRLRAERERACDDFVLASGTRGSEYANHLLDIAQSIQPARLSPLAATALAMARRSQLEGRLMAILDPSIRRSSAFSTRFAAASLIALVALPVAAIEFAPEEPEAVAVSSPPVTTPAASPRVGTPSPASAQPQSTVSAQAGTAKPQPAAPTRDERLLLTLNRSLLAFADEGDLDGVEAMLSLGADVNASIDGDGSALIAAADEGHVDVVRFLLGKGADPNLIVPGDGTALIAAAGEGHIEVVELLLQRGAQVNLVAEGDETALIQASGEGHLEVVKLLVSRGADVNLGVWADQWLVSDRDGRFNPIRLETELRTPLGEARDEGHLDVVRFLISAGARD